MIVFGSGTLPALLTLGISSGKLQANPEIRRIFARVAGAVIMLIGLQLILRGLASFHLIAHLKIGGLVIW